MKKDMMALAMHDNQIYQGKGRDKRWFTYVVDRKTGKRKKVGKRSKEDLIEYLYDYYFASGASVDDQKLYLPDIYPHWIQYRRAVVNCEATVRRNDTDFRKFYLEEPLSNKIMTTPLDQLTKNDLEKWAYQIIKKHDLTQKAYTNMSLIIRQIYTYLVDEDVLEQNTFAKVHIRNTAFRRNRKKAAQTQIFYDDEKDAIIRRASDLAEETLDESFLALPLLFYTGLRLGECLGLKFSDFDHNRNLLQVERSMIRKEQLNDDGSWKPTVYVIEDYLKQNEDPRSVIISDECFRIVKRVRVIKQKKGIISPYLFDVKTPNNIEMKLYRICDDLNIARRSPHKMRKTYVSELLNHDIDADFVRAQVGHKELRTTFNSYSYSTTRNEEMIEKLSQVL